MNTWIVILAGGLILGTVIAGCRRQYMEQ